MYMERRHLTNNPLCSSSCNLNWETTLHASRDHCHLAKSIWIVICFLQQILFHGWSGTLVQNLCQLMRFCGPSYPVWRCGTYGYGRVEMLVSLVIIIISQLIVLCQSLEAQLWIVGKIKVRTCAGEHSEAGPPSGVEIPYSRWVKLNMDGCNKGNP